MNGDCETCRRRLDDYLDGALAGAERRLVDTHLEACSRCRAEFDRFRLMDEDLCSLGVAADRLAAAESGARPARSHRAWWRVAAAVAIAVGLAAVGVRHGPALRQPDTQRGDRVISDGGSADSPVQGGRTTKEIGGSGFCIVQKDRRIAVRMRSENPRVHIVWLYESVAPDVDADGRVDSERPGVRPEAFVARAPRPSAHRRDGGATGVLGRIPS